MQSADVFRRKALASIQEYAESEAQRAMDEIEDQANEASANGDSGLLYSYTHRDPKYVRLVRDILIRNLTDLGFKIRTVVPTDDKSDQKEEVCSFEIEWLRE